MSGRIQSYPTVWIRFFSARLKKLEGRLTRMEWQLRLLWLLVLVGIGWQLLGRC